MVDSIYIIGAGAQAREIQDYLISDGAGQIVFVVDEEYLKDSPTNTISFDEFTKVKHTRPKCILGIGAPGAKQEFEARIPDARYYTFFSKNSFVSKATQIAEGSIMAPMAVATSGSDIGRHVTVNIGATISHDCRVGDFSTISPGANIGGRVRLGEGVFVGIGATIKNDIKIANGCVIGAGAVVVEDVIEPNTLLIGCPARPTRINQSWLREI